MERAAKSFAKLKLDSAISQEEIARVAWPSAVGRRIAVHAAAKSVVRGRLIVEVDDAVWQKQLVVTQGSVTANITKLIVSQ